MDTNYKNLKFFFALLLACVSPVLQAYPDMAQVEALALERYGSAASENVRHWRQMLAQAEALGDAEKLTHINKFFNLKIRYDEDSRTWQTADYWATPLETLSRARGDCEDLSIAKYVSLLLLGIPQNQLKLNYVTRHLDEEGRQINQPHMVLSYLSAPDAEPLILDNLVAGIFPESQRTDLELIFSFNDDFMWVAGSLGRQISTSGLSKWRGVISRMRTEGL